MTKIDALTECNLFISLDNFRFKGGDRKLHSLYISSNMAFVGLCTRYVVMMFIAISVYKCCIIQGSSLHDVDRLFDDVMEKAAYNNRTRPINDQDQAVPVNITFNLAAIKNLDEVSGEFSVVGAMQVMWIDERFKWNPDDYNGTTDIVMPQEEVWIPDLVMVNPAESIKELGENAKFSVRYYSSGVAVWMPVDVFKSVCSIDIRFYPFDIQNCSMNFIAWGYSKDEIFFNIPVETIGLGYYTDNGEWTIMERRVFAVNEGDTSMAIISLKLQRIPIFFIVTIVLPIMFLCFLNTLVFAIPVEAEEKVSFSITVFLAFAVFMTIIADHLPTTSNPVSMLCVYLLLNVIGSVFVCFFTILVRRVYQMEDEKSIPTWLNAIHSCFHCRCSRRKKNNYGMTYGQILSQCLDRTLLFVFFVYFIGVAVIYLTTAAVASYSEAF